MSALKPLVSVIIPTLNSGLYLGDCLRSIIEQDYPRDRVEIIVADGGSTDSTTDIAKSYHASVVPNPLRTGEAGKAAGLKFASGDYIAFIDSDNILPDKTWLNSMMKPFNDQSIIASEPLMFTHRSKDASITRYFALLGMGDPLCLFLGNYDHYCYITGRWTDLQIKAEICDYYTKIELEPNNLPTLGANGTIYKTDVIKRFVYDDYFFDIDVVAIIARESPRYFAKVHTGIIHIYTTSWRGFIKKQNRRVVDYLYYSKNDVRPYNWAAFSRLRLLWFVIATCTVVPVLIQSIVGYVRKPDSAWINHLIACAITLGVYSFAVIKIKLLGSDAPADRSNW